MRKEYTISIISFCLAVIIISVSYYYFVNRSASIPSTYFHYSTSELAKLKNLSSKNVISQRELRKWDDISFSLVRSSEFGDAYVSRAFAYLYTAMSDTAFLTYYHHHDFKVSLDPICTKVLCEFFTKDCQNIKKNVVTDEYSEVLSNIVMRKIKERIQYDKEHEQVYLPTKGETHWVGETPFDGQSVGHWKTWLIKSNQQFRAPPPPSSEDKFWDNQLALSKESLENITKSQKNVVVFWASGSGTLKWLQTANNYMEQQAIPPQQQLLIRSVLAMGIADSLIAVFDSKYTYWVKRPFMRDPSMQTVMPTPNHPSYPAGHSSIAAAAANILAYYFPSEKEKWFDMERAASDSRIHGGFHFPTDAEEGLIIGKKVANKAVSFERSKLLNE